MSDEDRDWTELRARVARINEAGSEALPLADALEVLRDEAAPAAVRRAVLGRRDIDESVIAEARNLADPGVRAHAVSLIGTPVSELERAADDPTWQVRSEVAAHPFTPLPVLVRLTSDPSSVVRRASLTRPEMSIEVLVDVVLTGTSRLDAEMAIARPSFVLAEHVEELLEAGDVGAAAVLTASDVPRALLARYAGSHYGSAVRAQALRAGAPGNVAARAVTAEDASVRLAAVEGGKCPPRALRVAAGDVAEAVRLAVATSHRTPTDAVDLLLQDLAEAVRRAAATSVNASPEALVLTIASDPDEKVRQLAVSNPTCPASAVIEGCRDEATVVFAASNPACPPEGLFAALLTLRDVPRTAPSDADPEGPSATRAAALARTVTEARRRLAPRSWAFLSTMPLEELAADDLDALLSRHLAKAVSDPRAQVRWAVAGHRLVNDEALLVLASDPDERVRQAVTLRILGATGGVTAS